MNISQHYYFGVDIGEEGQTKGTWMLSRVLKFCFSCSFPSLVLILILVWYKFNRDPRWGKLNRSLKRAKEILKNRKNLRKGKTERKIETTNHTKTKEANEKQTNRKQGHFFPPNHHLISTRYHTHMLQYTFYIDKITRYSRLEITFLIYV